MPLACPSSLERVRWPQTRPIHDEVRVSPARVYRGGSDIRFWTSSEYIRPARDLSGITLYSSGRRPASRNERRSSRRSGMVRG